MKTMLLLLLSFSFSLNADVCGPHLQKGDVCSAAVLTLRPTQITVGQAEVDAKVADLEAMGKKKLAKAIEKEPLPAVIGPGGVLYIVDHHHFAKALATIGEPNADVQVRDDLSGIDPADFPAAMAQNKYVYLYDENGEPQPFSALPENVMGLRDDPYRGLAWGVREKGGYQHTDSLYGDFAWADYFRPLIPLSMIEQDFDAAVAQALPLAHLPAAQNLPGYENP